jgi:hypothetical protein
MHGHVKILLKHIINKSFIYRLQLSYISVDVLEYGIVCNITTARHRCFYSMWNIHIIYTGHQ